MHYRLRIMKTLACGLILVVALSGCRKPPGERAAPAPARDSLERPGSFGADLSFLQAHTQIILLTSPDSTGPADAAAQIAVAPAYQGRVMTSTANGLDGASFGYIHRSGVSAGTRQPHMTVLGGEDRFWLGPEGGQYALYFAPGSPFDTEHWQVPAAIDWGGWPVVLQAAHEVTFEREMTLTNYAGTSFSLRVDRAIRVLDASAVAKLIGQAPGAGTRTVAYESENRITNTGQTSWKKDSGLLSIWILGMYRPGPRTTVVLPFVPGSPSDRGPVVNDAYFGPIAKDRLRIADGVLFFRADGKQRGKIGLPRPRARDVSGSYDPERHVLTLVRFTLPSASDYVNSMWERQQRPYAGDVVNSYNDGPLAPGAEPLGPFYEIESSSPAAALAPGGTLVHVHRTIHLQGPEAELDAIARAVLGVSLSEIMASLGS
jgi:hypothetical protein